MTEKHAPIWHWLVKGEYKLIGNKIYRNEGKTWNLAYTFRGVDGNMRAYVHFRQLTKEER